MSSLNKISLIGNIGASPESRFMPDGVQVASLSIATTEVWKDKEGQRQERTQWHKVIFFAGLAELACKYLEKGARIYVEGKLRTRKWTDQQQIERYSTEVIGRELIMLDKKNPGKHVDSRPDDAFDPTDIPF
jgi:single-strand DNA-binding protein